MAPKDLFFSFLHYTSQHPELCSLGQNFSTETYKEHAHVAVCAYHIHMYACTGAMTF